MKISATYLLLLAILPVFSSCKKDGVKKTGIEITDKDLTVCPDNADCEFLYTEGADISKQLLFQPGNYRLFWSSFRYSGIDSRLYIRTPQDAREFYLKRQDFESKVLLTSICPACFSIPMRPVEGYIKGINVSPDKRADQTKWLLEVKLYLMPQGGSKVTDTLFIKQYFYPNFVIN
ncbi:hypothetical protein [Pedobacter sp. JY14-1]|uniref:hypothetical protein n=1 Tax=Pedobacter sp. JY14-1 TaxID=3034151 RepID=UPI0023E33834|nr:hypothetical protein [Pedobacter sp. JY14-1]